MSFKANVLVIGAASILVPQYANAESENPVRLPIAIEQAEETWGGHVISAEMDRKRNGTLVYEIKLLQGNVVRSAEINAVTGKPINIKKAWLPTYSLRLFETERLVHARKAEKLGEHLKRLEERTKGQVLSAEFEIEAGQPRFEVELSTEMGVADIYLHPVTGERLPMIFGD